MKKYDIKTCSGLFLLLTVIGIFGLMNPAGAQEKQENKFKLKPGARGKNCLTCHVDFQDKIKMPSVHTPVKNGDCTGCHNPHDSSHGKLLAADPNKICFTCHADIIPKSAISIHRVASEGNCIKCHDPHSSKNKYNLLSSGNDLCFGCHSEMGNVIKNVKFKHFPVEKGCINCHNPHSSGKSAHLLKDAVPTLCLTCHKSENPSFKKQHMNYPVAKGRCTSCHDPHGSNSGGILFTNVHRPVANRMCNQCHEEPTSQTPFATKRKGFELCRGCHSAMVNDAFVKNRIHWPLADKTGCLNCHNPHAAPEKPLLKSKQVELCGQCHADIIEKQKRSPTKHKPVNDGQCTTCHSPHASNNVFLFGQASSVDLCKTCHDYSKHSTHPVGSSTLDPRNNNSIVTCTSCHGTHGTENKHMLWYPTINDMCTQCHTKLQ